MRLRGEEDPRSQLIARGLEAVLAAQSDRMPEIGSFTTAAPSAQPLAPVLEESLKPLPRPRQASNATHMDRALLLGQEPLRVR